MVNPYIRTMVWEGCLNAARLSRYYEALAGRYNLFYTGIRAALLFAVILSVASPYYLPTPSSFITTLPTVGVICVTAILVVADYVGNFAKKGSILHTTSIQVSSLETRWEMLWLDVNDLDADEDAVRRELIILQRRMITATEQVGYEGIKTDKNLNLKCAKEADELYINRFSGRTTTYTTAAPLHHRIGK